MSSKHGTAVVIYFNYCYSCVNILGSYIHCLSVSGPGIAINCMNVNEAFCVTGSDDGFLRLWPLTFREVYLEAEHEGPVTAVDISADGSRILAGTTTVSIYK